MRVTIGRVTLDDGQPDEPAPPAFPNGPTVHIFDDWAHAKAIMREQMTTTGPWSPDGKSMIYTAATDPEAFVGLEPKAIIDHTSRNPWPPALTHVLEWRAARARIRIERAPAA